MNVTTNYEELTAGDLMSTKTLSCDPEASVMEALRQMDEHHVHISGFAKFQCCSRSHRDYVNAAKIFRFKLG